MVDTKKKGNLYLEPSSRSSRLYNEAVKVMPGGNSRSTVYWPPHPFYAAYGEGCYLTDVEGVTRLDFHNNYTSLIHGHADPDVVKACSEQLKRGTALGAPSEGEVELAKIITSRVRSVEHVRFANSGSEGVLMAIRVARAYTGREKIAKFEGSYHGNYDHVEVSVVAAPEEMGPKDNPTSISDGYGLPRRVLEEVIVLPFNNEEAVARLIERNHKELAAVIADPLPSRPGVIPPKPGFYKFLRDITKKYGIMLIADEVMSFRLSYGGGQEMFGMEPDISSFGKIIGGGFPVGGFGASAEIMSVCDPSKGTPKVPHGGTFNANVITMVAGQVTLEKFTAAEIKRINSLGDRLRSKLTELFSRLKVKAQIAGAGSMFRVHLISEPLIDYRSTYLYPDRKKRMDQLFFMLLEEGIYIPSEGFGNISTPMTEKEIDMFVLAMERSLPRLMEAFPELKA
jgi:glutamate-1-semialdehyde 2,1-aminomutase